MEVKIDSTNENKLLDRKEVYASVHFPGATPPRAEIKKEICQKIAADPDLVVLRSVANEFGMKRVKVSAHVYTDKETLERNEPEYIRKREGFGKEAAPAEKKEEPKKEEAPKEEKPNAEEKKEEKPKKQDTKPETGNPKQDTGKPDTGNPKPETPKEG